MLPSLRSTYPAAKKAGRSRVYPSIVVLQAQEVFFANSFFKRRRDQSVEFLIIELSDRGVEIFRQHMPRGPRFGFAGDDGQG